LKSTGLFAAFAATATGVARVAGDDGMAGGPGNEVASYETYVGGPGRDYFTGDAGRNVFWWPPHRLDLPMSC
jgi:hypothetical protein